MVTSVAAAVIITGAASTYSRDFAGRQLLQQLLRLQDLSQGRYDRESSAFDIDLADLVQEPVVIAAVDQDLPFGNWVAWCCLSPALAECSVSEFDQTCPEANASFRSGVGESLAPFV